MRFGITIVSSGIASPGCRNGCYETAGPYTSVHGAMGCRVAESQARLMVSAKVDQTCRCNVHILIRPDVFSAWDRESRISNAPFD